MARPPDPPAEEPAALGRLCYALGARMTARALTRAYDAALRPLGMGVPQFGVLSAVALELDVSETALAERLGLDRTTLVRNLALLRRKGWVEPAEARGRGARHRLTPAGADALAAARPAWAEAHRRIEEALGRSGAAEAARGALRDLRRAARAAAAPATGGVDSRSAP